MQASKRFIVRSALPLHPLAMSSVATLSARILGTQLIAIQNHLYQYNTTVKLGMALSVHTCDCRGSGKCH